MPKKNQFEKNNNLRKGTKLNKKKQATESLKQKYLEVFKLRKNVS